MSSLHELIRTGKRVYRRVGRGQSSTRGKTSGRGGKGQTARAGNKRRPEMRDIIKKLPKRRGYGKNRARTVNAARALATTVSLARLESWFENGAEISVATLRAKGILGRKDMSAKIVGNEVGKRFSIKGLILSGPARTAVEKAGGTIAVESARGGSALGQKASGGAA